jgi:hypothetical protein
MSENVGMPMRESCKFFESRTYPSGDSVRKCDLDLAPDAPWRCPDDCQAYTPRLADVNWAHGSMVTPPPPPEPSSVAAKDPSISSLLDEAEDIVNAVVDETRRAVDGDRHDNARFGDDRSRSGWRRFFRRS